MRPHSIGKIFLATAALGAVVGKVALASATLTTIGTTSTLGTISYVLPFVRRVAPQSCQYWQSPGNPNASAPITNDNAHEISPTGSYGASLLCPIPDDNNLTHAQVTSLKVYGYDGNGNGYSQAQACVTYLTTNGGACSWYPNYSGFPYTGAAGTGAQYVGNFAITFTTSGSGYQYQADDSLYVWTSHPADMPYVWVNIEPGDTFHGITVSQ